MTLNPVVLGGKGGDARKKNPFKTYAQGPFLASSGLLEIEERTQIRIGPVFGPLRLEGSKTSAQRQ